MSDPSPSSSEEHKSETNEEPRKGSGTRKSVEFADQIERKHIVDREEDDEDEPFDPNDNDEDLNKVMDDTKNIPSDGSDSESEVDIGVKQDVEESSSEASFPAVDKPDERAAHPRIARGFRPEIFDERDLANLDSRTSKRSVSFTPAEMAKSNALAVKEISKRKTYDGREITMVTLDTQTDWDWAKNAIETGKQILVGEGESVDQGKERSDLKSILVKPDSRENTSQSKTDTTEISLDDQMAATTPFTPYSDEFGIPILDISSDSDSSDEESHRNSQEDRNFLPSIGPPQILQYIRESEQSTLEVDEPDSRKNDADNAEIPKENLDEFGRPYGMFGGKCEFCQGTIKPFPSDTLQQSVSSSKLFCCDEYREFVNFATTTAMELEEEAKNANKLINIKPHAHFGSKKDRKMAKERAVQRMRERELQRRQQEATGLQQNFYSSKNGVHNADSNSTNLVDGKAATIDDQMAKTTFSEDQKIKTTFSEDLKEKSTVRQGSADKKFQDPGSNVGDSDKFADFFPDIFQDTEPKKKVFKPKLFRVPKRKKYVEWRPKKLSVNRQMKTINYQLSSQRCLDEGWTLRPPSPLDNDDDDVDIFIPEPVNPSMSINSRPLIQKFYEDGKKFLTMFPDGSGNVFYPSGQVAILISCVSFGQYIYVIHDDSSNHKVQAVFEPNGYGSCYHNNGIIRLYFDQLGGIELDPHGGKRRKWSWKDPETHVHAPPFQPICVGLNRNIGIRVMSQDNIALTLTARRRSCRFNVGARLKLVAPEHIPPPEIDDSSLFLDEHKVYVESILDKVTNLLKFPKSPKLDKILPPIHVTSKQQRTERIRREKTTSRMAGQKTTRKVVLPVVSVT